MPKRKPERSESQKQRDRRRISEMYLRGDLQADIAKELSLSQSTVSADLAVLRDEWLASSIMDFNDRRAQELAKIDDLEREYWTAWKRSQQDAEIRVKEAIKRGEKNQETMIQKAQERTEAQIGDPRYLSGIQWCINKRCELLGLDAPKKIAPTKPDGSQLPENQVVMIYLPDNNRNDTNQN